MEDKSFRPKDIRTSLTQKQEERICFERKQFKKTIEDIFFTLEGEIPNIYPVKIYRCLKRYGLDIFPNKFKDVEKKINKFRKYAGGKFIKKLIKFYPYKINYILSDNGPEFGYNNMPKKQRPKDRLHPFDEVCKKHNIEHRTIKYKHPWTNGMIERFNRTIKEGVLKKITFNSNNSYET